MTEAEKITEEWSERFNFEYPLTQKLQLKQLIHQVAERTREECYRMIVKKMEVTKYTGWKPLNDCLLTIRNARWEDKEV